jgi:hypothetical protein
MTPVPNNLIDYLEKVIPGFDREIKKFEVAKMLWMMVNPNRCHLVYKNSINLSHKSLVELFGRSPSFDDINRRSFRYFSVHRFFNGKDAEGRSYNNGYEPKPWMLHALADFLKLPAVPTSLLNDVGKVIKRAPKAIDSKTKNKHSAHGWRGVEVPSLIQVNVSNLERLKKFYLNNETIQANDERDKNFYKFLIASALLTQANSNFHGSLLHRYVQSQSGRLYAEGLNLQNCPKEIRNAGLEGYWDYDINCCHFSILEQMAKKLDFDCPVIRSYVSDKNVIRAEIAQGVGITIPQAKLVLTATIYGARKGLQTRNAIPKVIGIEAAESLYIHKSYKAIADEINQAKKAVLERYPHPNGRYINEFKMSISTKRGKASILSHLMEGVEAVALRSAVRYCQDKVLLLQHDGFVLKQPIDSAKIEQTIFHDTGYQFTYDQKKITCPIQKEFELFGIDDTKSTIDEIFNEYNGLEPKIRGSLQTMAPLYADIPPVYPDTWDSETLF